MSTHKLDGARIRVALHEGQSDSSQRLETLTALSKPPVAAARA